MKTEVEKMLQFFVMSEKLKTELRHSWLSDGRQESVAEHCWQMSLMALVLSPYLEHSVNLTHVLKMVIVHDLVEAKVGDVPFFEKSERKEKKHEREAQAIEEIKEMLPVGLGDEVRTLWYEFEDRTTTEARFAVALDNLEVQIQHNLADLATWLPLEQELVYTKMEKPCAHDTFLQAFKDVVIAQAEDCFRAAGLDPRAIRARAEQAT